MAKLIALLLLLVLSHVANALQVSDLNQMKAHNEASYNIYLFGVGEGIFWANYEIGQNGGPKLFCLPGSLPLTKEFYVSMYEQELVTQSRLKEGASDSRFAEVVLIESLKRTFPCE